MIRYVVVLGNDPVLRGVYEVPNGNYVKWEDAEPLQNKITKLEAQLKHNSDRDYNRGFEDGLCAGLNGGTRW